MGVPQRVRGDDVNILVTQDGDLQDTLTDVVDFDSTFMVELISKGYLGEKSERKDMIFKGVSFKMTMHLHKQDFVRFIKAIVNKAQRLTPDVVFSITGLFSFPNGETPVVLIPNVSFGEVPQTVPARGDYVKVKLEFATDDDQVTTS